MAPQSKHHPLQSTDASSPSQSSTASLENQNISQPTTFKTSFQFVVNEDSKQARQTVRKHVMREYRRRERWEHSGAVAAPPRVAKKDPAPGPKIRRRRRELLNSSAESPPSKESSPVEGLVSHYERAANGSFVGERVRDGSHSGSENEIEEFGQIDMSVGGFDSGNILPPTQDSSRVYFADPWAAVGRSLVDPFSNSNFDNGPDLQSILYYYAWVMPRLMDDDVAGIDFRRIGWLYSFVFPHDPTPAHTVMGFILANRAIRCYGYEEPPEAIEHKAKALQLIKERTEDPIEATSNATMGAVVHIAAHELVAGNSQGFALHMTGLNRMIISRGGFEAIDSASLKAIILRLELLRAYLVISHPRYPRFAPIRAIEPIAIKIPSSARDWEEMSTETVESHQSVYRFCEDCLRIIHGLEDLMLVIGSAAQQKKRPSDQELHSLFWDAVFHLLTDDDNETRNATLAIARRCCRLAALILVDVVIHERLHKQPQEGFFIRVLRKNLLDVNEHWGRSYEMFITIMSRTDRLALEKSMRAWYIADVIMLTVNMSRDKWTRIEGKLLAYIRENPLAKVRDPQDSHIFDMSSLTDMLVNS